MSSNRENQLKEALIEDPNNIIVLIDLGFYYYNEQNYKDAILQFEKGLELDSRFPYSSIEKQGLVWKCLGMSSYNFWYNSLVENDTILEKSINALQKSLSFVEENSDNLEIIFMLAKVYEVLGDFGGALRVLSNIMLDYGNHPRISEVTLLAGIHCLHPELESSGGYNQSSKYFEQLFEDNPNPIYNQIQITFILARVYELRKEKKIKKKNE